MRERPPKPHRRSVGGVKVSNLFDNGTKLGATHHAERDYIRWLLERRYGEIKPHTMEWFRREQRINQIQERIHRHDKSYRELCALRAAAQPCAHW
jgi:hypothetical protein